MSATRPDIPCIDENCTSATVHELAEKIAVPVYDWISMPVIAIVDGLIHIDPDDEPSPTEPTLAQRLAAARGAASPVNADPEH